VGGFLALGLQAVGEPDHDPETVGQQTVCEQAVGQLDDETVCECEHTLHPLPRCDLRERAESRTPPNQPEAIPVPLSSLCPELDVRGPTRHLCRSPGLPQLVDEEGIEPSGRRTH